MQTGDTLQQVPFLGNMPFCLYLGLYSLQSHALQKGINGLCSRIIWSLSEDNGSDCVADSVTIKINGGFAIGIDGGFAIVMGGGIHRNTQEISRYSTCWKNYLDEFHLIRTISDMSILLANDFAQFQVMKLLRSIWHQLWISHVLYGERLISSLFFYNPWGLE